MRIMRETWIVFARAMRLSLRNPVWTIIGLMQPILYLGLFGPLLEPMSQVPGVPPGESWQWFVPGILIQLGIFGAAFVGFGLVAEYRAGVVERMRVTPASRIALLTGRVLRDVVVLLVQSVLLVLIAMFVFGLDAPFWGLLVGLALVGLVGMSLAALSYAVALTLKSEDALAPLLNGIALPVLLLSGVLLPMSVAPSWLQTLSDFNPFKHIVDGARALFRGDMTSSVALLGLVVTLALVIVGMTIGTRTFRRESA
jgi:ABC-2 type transport system permease protein